MTTCYDFEGWGPASRIRDFDLTPCFEDGVILSPLLTGFLCAAIYTSACLYSTRPRESFNNSQTLLRLRVKLALLFAASCVSTTNLILAFTDSIAVSLSIPYILEPLWFLIAMLLTYLNHSRSRTSSGVILLFWPLYTGFLVVRTRTITLSSGSLLPPSAIIRCTLGLLGCASFVFEWRRPYKISHPDTNKIQAEIPIMTANIYNRWSFSWLTPLMKKGAVKIVTENDLPPLRSCDESEYLGHQLENNLQRHSLWKALFIAFGRPYIVAAMLKLCQDTLAFLQPQLLRWLLAYISRYPRALDKVVKPNVLEGFSIALTMFLAAVIQSITLNQYFQRAFETGMRVRAGLVNVIYKKALLLSNDERARATGDIVNLMSVDATRLQDLCTYGLISLSGPFQITLAFMSLYSLLGWSAFVGVAIMVVSVPLNTFIARFLKRMQEQQMKNRDKRTRLMSELLNNIRSIKFYAWESSFLRKILDTRNSHELKTLRKIGIVTSCNMALWSGIPLLVAFSSFATAALTSSRPLTADVIFPSISLFMLLQFPLAMFSQVTSNIIEAMVSVRRLTDFLGAQEVQPDARKLVEVEVLKPGDIVLAIRHGEFSWSSRSASPTLENINLCVKAGELIGILGRVGAGKSSLLSAVIGDMIRTEGEVVVTGSIAYASQNPWIMSATVRHNIVFSHEYDEHFYNLVLEACALVQDLSVLPNGDLTEVGERGITLSGGQRARIALARAVYARADLVLLDDCLAAVDSHVARHVFDNVIGPRGLLSSKARILVTNSVTFASQFDQLAYLRRGIILENGSYDNLMNNTSGEVYRLIRGHGVNHSGTITPLGPENTNTPYVDTIYENTQRIKRLEDSLTEKTWQSVNYRKAKLAKLPALRESASLGLIKEHQEHGQVKLRVYKEYIKAASRIGFSLFTVATVAQQAASVLASLTLRYWGEHNREAGNNSGMFWYLLVYGLLSLLSTILGGLNAVMMWVFCALRSAQRLHDSMLGILLHAPLSYFELTPAGRILNLFSRDIYVVDQILPRVLQQLFRTLAVCLSIVAVIGGSFPPFLLFIFPLGWFYLRVMKFYLATSRELKRLDAVSRSPIFAWFSETLAGTSIIRAFDQTAVFVNSNQHRLDRNQICYLPSIYVNRWLAVRLEFVGALIILIVAMLAMLALSTTGVDAGLVGLVLSYALNTTSSLNWVVRSASEVEQNIVSVERILHQTEVKSEAPHEIPDGGLDEDWPFRGEIEFQEYSTRYRPELGLVLKEISLKICAGEKIGICGRTGAGKSSLLLALFRIIEPATGIILIDSVDVTKIGLHDLRSAISIVPQTPDLFEGTLRENIDPLGQYTDLDIWSSLEQAHLKDYIDSLSEKLDTPITEGGMSLSAGQRQLLCFTRALLRKSRILVLDEATSAVDLDTDQAIQSIIRGPAFTNVTILTIAHRLHTIMESDRILVMESGRIAEFSEPRALLANKDSIFFSLAEEAGLITTDS
ncbi:hypothetical protein AMATHDRAFT_82867 [Amanita thiersii Skay4041]|uniref:Metal resistance protein YCF1 n=1 Tax=Amanita thiersii Skay4041 TaxID=703135 RepID=A0A2A9NCZ9_9AGAR|nr:hypothetical protein AMATHDRAFT_82867 [Amanita thiersii Skay4041]